MVCRTNSRQFQAILFAALVALSLALPATAQNLIVGRVTDGQTGEVVGGADILVEHPTSGRSYDVKTLEDGTYTQLGLIAGEYLVTATKEGQGTAKTEVTVRGGTIPVNLILRLTRGEVLTKVFNEGVAASAAGNYDEAITFFEEMIKVNPQCPECYYNMGVAYSEKKDFEQAEAAYKKAIEQEPGNADAYNGLAQVLTSQRKSDEASEAAKKGAELMAAAAPVGGGDPEALVNQGKIFINAGNMAEAKTQFERALAALPSHAEAHYLLGTVYVGEANFAGAVKEFETYLELAAAGPFAAQAQENVNTLKPLIQ